MPKILKINKINKTCFQIHLSKICDLIIRNFDERNNPQYSQTTFRDKSTWKVKTAVSTAITRKHLSDNMNVYALQLNKAWF